MKNRKPYDGPRDITAVLQRVRRSTRRGKQGLLFVAKDEQDKEWRWWITNLRNERISIVEERKDRNE